MPDDHSELVPLLPIPNRKVKRLCADDSAGSRVKVGHRQALMPETPNRKVGRFSLCKKKLACKSAINFFSVHVACELSCYALFEEVYLAERNSRRRIFPTFDLGSSSRNSMYLGILYPVRF